MKKILRITYYAGITLVFILVALVGFTQTRGFRNSLQNYILSHYQTILKGQLSIGKIEGNLITGIRLYDVSVRNADTSVFASERIELGYDPFALLFKRVSLSRAKVVNPHVYLCRSAHGQWNISDLLIVSKDTAPSPWVISIKNLELVDARVVMIDSLMLWERAQGLRITPPAGVVDYANVIVDSLDFAAELSIRTSETYVRVYRVSGTLDDPRIRLRHFQGDLKLTENEASLSDGRLITEGSRLGLDAVISKVNVAAIRDLAELKLKPVNINLQAEKIDTRELKQFVYPWVDFLDKSLELQVQANGEFGRLNVHKVLIRTPQSLLIVGGTISNLHRPKDLELDLYCTNSLIDPNDIQEHVPGLAIPDLRALGKTKFYLTFKGAPSNFASTIKATTDAGNIDVDAQLKINDILEYKASFTTNNLDLSKIFAEPDLASHLNITGTLNGSGTAIHTTSAVVRIELDSSEFWEIPLGQSALVFDLNNEILRSHAQLRARSTMMEFSSVMKFPRTDSISYTLTGNVNSLNLADIIRDNQFWSDLSFKLRAAGKGIEISRMKSSVTIGFLRSAFGGVSFDQGDLEAAQDLTNEKNSFFTLRSEPIDLDVHGKFTLAALVENVINSVRIVSEAISHRFQTLDSLRGSSVPSGPREVYSLLHDKKPKFIDAEYSLKARNLYPVGVFFQKDFSGALSMSGSIRGSVDSLDFLTSAQIQSFRYRNQTDTYRVENGSLALDLKNISRTSPLEVLDAKLDARFGEFGVNKLAFYNTSIALASQMDSGSYQWSALVDSAYQIDLRGISSFKPSVYTFELSQLRVGMDFYILENNDPVTLKLGRGSLFAQNLHLTHEVEDLGVDGYFSTAGKSDLKISVNNFLLNDLQSVLHKTRLAGPVKELNGILNATLDFKGTMEDPEMSLDVTANGFRSNQLVFGQIVARSSYSDHLLSLFVELRNKKSSLETTPDLLVSGTVPYELSLSGPSGHKPEGQINLTMFSRGLDLQLLNPFLPAVSNLTGILTCDTRIRGTVEAPAYEGNIRLQNARFLFDPLGIYFLIDGKLIPSGERVAFENFVIRNIPSDRNDGQMNITGTFSLAGLKLEDFDLKANGQLLVLKESSRLAGQQFYGDLFVATGQNGVRWQGLLSASKVSGDLSIKNGKMTLPPERETISSVSRSINVIFRDDTSKALKSDDSKLSKATGSTQYGSKVLDNQQSYTKVSSVSGPTETGTKSFLDNISYELNIDVQGPFSLLFVFNTQMNEELFADLKGKLSFNKTTTQTRLTGEVNLESRSYYSFFKRFDASGKIYFTGDPLNPELDVIAKYSGIHTITLDTLSPGFRELPKTPSGQKLTAERVNVVVKITGTKNAPKPKFDLAFPDRDKNSSYVSKDPESDAMSFLVTGYMKDELDPQQRGSYLTGNMLSGLTAGLITGPLTNALKKQVSAIQSVDLQYYGGDWNKTDVRVTAEISSAVIRFGGRVIEGLNNTNITVEVPVGSVIGSDSWRNLLFKYERKIDAVETIDQRRETNGLSLFYRIIF